MKILHNTGFFPFHLMNPRKTSKPQEIGKLLPLGQGRFFRILRGKIQIFPEIQGIYTNLHIAARQQCS